MAPSGDRSRWRTIGAASLAGWLFADLMLVLFVTTLASTTVPAAPKPPAPVAAPSPQPPGQRVLVLHVHEIPLTISAVGIAANSGTAVHALVAQFRRRLKRIGFSDARAGLVETFDAAPESSSAAIDLARRINHIITKHFPLFAQAVTQSYWEAGPAGGAEVKIFFFAHAAS